MASSKIVTKIFWGLTFFALASITFLGILFSYWQLQPYELPYIKEPIKILNEDKTVRVGEPIKMEVHYIKLQQTTSINSSPRIECESGNLVTLVGRNVDLPLGQHTIVSDSYLLPPKILDGDKCRFFFQTTFRINPIKTVQEDWVSDTFTVKTGEHNGTPTKI